MFNQVKMRNFGPIKQLDWSNLGNINLIIGENASGKTFLLKALYCAVKTIETYRRGNEQRSASEILLEKLRWTFEVDKIGDLVTKGAVESLEFEATFNKKVLHYSFGKETNKDISTLENHIESRDRNSILLPAKEVLSAHRSILEIRNLKQLFGFDQTYIDLINALLIPATKGRNYTSFATARRKVANLINGIVYLDTASNEWYFKNRSNQKFSIRVTAEGIKKIGVLDNLLKNQYLSPGSIIFIDEPEANLHPKAISDFLDIVADLSSDFQFIMASHSYFVVQKLYLIATQKRMDIPVLQYDKAKNEWLQRDLSKDKSENSIIDEMMNLYEEEVKVF